MTFVRAWLRAPLRTGAVAPSSAALARAMAAAAAPRDDAPVVELGPGTGIVTEALVASGVPEERLILVELGPDFRRVLARRYPRARILSGDAFAVVEGLHQAGERAAAVVSSLPLLTHPRAKRAAFCRAALGLTGPEGRLVQFTYSPLPPIPRDPSIQATRSRRIWTNMPSAVVWTYAQRRAGIETAGERAHPSPAAA